MSLGTRTLPRRLILLVTCLIVLVRWHHPVQHAVLTVVRFPLVVVRTVVGGIVWLPRVPSLAQENVQLREELAVSRLERARIGDALRRLTAGSQLLASSPAREAVAASIIGRDLLPTDHTVILDKGAKDRIAVDGVVVSAEGVVGRVVDVGPTTSVVMLLTDSNSRIAAMVERSRETGLIVGTGERLIAMIYVDLDGDVQVNDVVVTAGFGGVFPKGLTVGTVVRVVRDEQQATTTAWLKPAVALNRLEGVLCLVPSG